MAEGRDPVDDDAAQMGNSVDLPCLQDRFIMRGTLVHSKIPEQVEILEDHIIGVKEGKIVFVEHCLDLEALSQKYGFDKEKVQTLPKCQFLMPGLVDTHIHASQYVESGTGYDKQVLDWLLKYIYPTEALFKDVKVAREVYPLVVKLTLRHGTTTACYFTTIHLEASKEFSRIVAEIGQRAFVSKVNMDRDSPKYYTESTRQSVEDTREFIEFVQGMKNPLVQPVITPRFNPTCSPELLKSLGKLAKEMGDVHIQSHMGEQPVNSHPRPATTFDESGLLTDKALMAHGLYLEDSELELFQKRGVGIAHCPSSNLNLKSGILDARRMIDLGMKIGLGTDVSAGNSPSILNAMRTAVHVSKALSFNMPDDYKTISHHEAIYMGTLGGAKVLAIDDQIGSFEVGKQFDALLIDTKAPATPCPVFDVFEKETADDMLMKFFYQGDDRNIVKRFVAGKEIILD